MEAAECNDSNQISWQHADAPHCHLHIHLHLCIHLIAAVCLQQGSVSVSKTQLQASLHCQIAERAPGTASRLPGPLLSVQSSSTAINTNIIATHEHLGRRLGWPATRRRCRVAACSTAVGGSRCTRHRRVWDSVACRNLQQTHASVSSIVLTQNVIVCYSLWASRCGDRKPCKVVSHRSLVAVIFKLSRKCTNSAPALTT